MELEVSRDFELIRKLMTHPDIYPHIADDGCPSAEEFEPLKHPDFRYVVVSREGKPMGLFLVVPRTVAMAEVHTCFLPEARGEFAREAAARFLTWFWQNSAYRRLIAEIPAGNKGAIGMAQHVGFKEYGVNREAFLKGGKLLDLRLFGLSRPAVGV